MATKKKTAAKTAAKKKAPAKKASAKSADETASKGKAPAKKTAAKSSAKAKPATKAAKSPKASAKKKADTAQDTKDTPVTEASENDSKKLTGSALEASEIMNSDDPGPRIAELTENLVDSRSSVATKAARTLHEIVSEKPELLVTHVERFARGLTSKQKRVVQTSADALPAIAKIAPARVAKHLDVLKAAFEPTLHDGKDGLVRTFANLCTASVAYQKRLEPVLTLALQTAGGKALQRWTAIVLPALKGEPHARARSVVEDRLDRIPRSIAQQIASQMNFKLRVRYR